MSRYSEESASQYIGDTVGICILRDSGEIMGRLREIDPAEETGHWTVDLDEKMLSNLREQNESRHD